MNLIEISPMVIEIQGIEKSDLVVLANNTLVCHTAFLATDTRLCVLIKDHQGQESQTNNEALGNKCNIISYIKSCMWIVTHSLKYLFTYVCTCKSCISEIDNS